MLMTKLVILFIIFFLSNLIGKMIAGKYRYRYEELKQMKSALNMFKTKIKFSYDTIPEIFEEISKNFNRNVGQVFQNAKVKMDYKSAEESWKESIEESENNMTDEDKQILVMMSKMLGKSDVDGQISQIDITLEFLEKQLENSFEEKNKNERLFRKLGTIMGLTLVTILV